MLVTLTFLGTSSGWPEKGRYFSSYLIETETVLLLFDVNEETVRYLMSTDKFQKPLHIFISHTHADHISGLWVLLQAAQQKKFGQQVSFYLPQDLNNLFLELLPLHLLFPERLAFSFQTFSLTSDVVLNALRITPIKNRHTEKYQSYAKTELVSVSFLIQHSSGKKIVLTMDVKDENDVILPTFTQPEFLVLDGSHLTQNGIEKSLTCIQPKGVRISHYAQQFQNQHPEIPFARHEEKVQIWLS